MKTMRKVMLGAFMAAAVTLAAVQADASPSREMIVAIDISRSNAIIMDDAIAARAAALLDTQLKALEAGDIVRFRTLGNYGLAANALRLDFEVGRRMPASKVASAISKLVRGFPALVRAGKIPAADATQITGFLEAEAHRLDCSAHETTLILFSDGIESAPEFSPGEFMAGRASLPQAPAGILKGCSIAMYGIGENVGGGAPATTRHLIKEWTRWTGEAGATFAPYPSF